MSLLTLTISFDRYTQAFADTLTMVGASAAIALTAGILLAVLVLLIVTAPSGFLASPRFNRVAGGVVNGFRATPFIVLLVALIPFTWLVAGTTIGVRTPVRSTGNLFARGSGATRTIDCFRPILNPERSTWIVNRFQGARIPLGQ